MYFLPFISYLSAFVIKNESLGYFLLGVCISTIIITIQSNMAAKVEESRLLTEKLRKMYDLCFGFDKFYSFSIEIFDVDFAFLMHYLRGGRINGEDKD